MNKIAFIVIVPLLTFIDVSVGDWMYKETGNLALGFITALLCGILQTCLIILGNVVLLTE